MFTRRSLIHSSGRMAGRKTLFACVVLGIFCWQFIWNRKPDTLKLGQLQLDLTSSRLTIRSANGDVFSGALATDRELGDATIKPIECDNSRESSNKKCLLYPGLAKLEIKAINRGVGQSCYYIQWQPFRNRFIANDCFSLRGAHWFGGAEVFEQHWPMNRQKSRMQPFQSGDVISKEWLHSGAGKYGSILEPYWLSSAGIGIYVDPVVNLHSSFNQDDNQQLCLRADPASFVKPNDLRKKSSKLKYTICTAPDIKTVHSYMSNRFMERPMGQPDERMMRSPVWSTWARHKTLVNQSLTLQYAQEIVDNGFTNSQLEIDDKYTLTYGDLEWDPKKFPDAKGMVDQLHAAGFRVTTWTHPFANIDSSSFREGAERGLWLKDMTGTVPGLTEWWQGIAGVIDPTHIEAVNWFIQIHREFMKRYGVDSFKFDAGEITYTPAFFSAKEQPKNVNEFTQKYVEMVSSLGSMIEVRAGYRSQQYPVFVRMLDKFSTWGYDNGLRTLIPTALLMSILGYPYILPDMIGGNAYSENDFSTSTILPDRELFIRWAQVTAFMPAMQFSIAPWQYDKEVVEICKKFVLIHEELVTPIVLKAAADLNEGSSVVRPLWWLDPTDANNFQIDSEFLVGDELLVAPVLEDKARERDVYLPKGQWRGELDGKVYAGQTWLRRYKVQLHELALFRRVE